MSRQGRTGVLAALGACCGLACVPAWPQAGPDLVLVRVSIPTLYSAQNVGKLEMAQAVLPPRLAMNSATPSELILSEYNFGVSNDAAAFAAVLGSVLELNRAADATKLRRGRVLIPQIPPRSLQNYNAALMRNRVPRIASFLPGDLTRIGSGDSTQVVFRESARLSNRARPGATATQVFAWVPSDKVAQSAEAFGKDGVATVIAQAVQVMPANCGPSQKLPPSNGVFSQALRQRVQNALAGARRNATLVVFDSGWPNEDAYARSTEIMRDMLHAIGTRFGYRSRRFPSRAEVAATRNSISPDAHTRVIADAIGEFAALDAQERVKVLYLPYQTKVPGARALMNEVIDFRMWVLEQESRPASVAAAAFADLEAARLDLRRQADAIVDRIAVLNAAIAPTSTAAYTDWGLVQGLMLLLGYHSDATDTTGFLNLSWTSDRPPLSFAGNDRTLIVSAAGNDGRDIYATAPSGVFIAQRSLAHADTLAVMNGTKQGRLDGSSCVSDLQLANGNAITFDGRVGSSSGTSFAAPRVAWLLALRAAVRPQPIDPNWHADTRQWLRGLMSGGSTVYERTWLDPDKFLDRLQN